MTDLLETGNTWLRSTLKSKVSQTVTIKRGANSNSVSAVPGNTRTEVADEEGMIVNSKLKDFLIDAADYDFDDGNGAVDPAEGDEIRQTVGSTTYVFQVLPLGQEPAWRWSDPYRKTLRIHTKLYGTE